MGQSPANALPKPLSKDRICKEGNILCCFCFVSTQDASHDASRSIRTGQKKNAASYPNRTPKIHRFSDGNCRSSIPLSLGRSIRTRCTRYFERRIVMDVSRVRPRSVSGASPFRLGCVPVSSLLLCNGLGDIAQVLDCPDVEPMIRFRGLESSANSRS